MVHAGNINAPLVSQMPRHRFHGTKMHMIYHHILSNISTFSRYTGKLCTVGNNNKTAEISGEDLSELCYIYNHNTNNCAPSTCSNFSTRLKDGYRAHKLHNYDRTYNVTIWRRRMGNSEEAYNIE